MSGREDLTVADVAGERIAYLLPVVAESMPPAVREGIARRRLTALTGACPCGATFVPPSRSERRRAARRGEVLRATVWHEADCPAGTQRILEAVAAARGGGR